MPEEIGVMTRFQQRQAGSGTLLGVFPPVPQPQPWPVLAFASASATQHASTPVGAGPPQQPEDAPPATVTAPVEQTPVSGSTSWTSSAATRSPARAAATD